MIDKSMSFGPPTSGFGAPTNGFGGAGSGFGTAGGGFGGGNPQGGFGGSSTANPFGQTAHQPIVFGGQRSSPPTPAVSTDHTSLSFVS